MCGVSQREYLYKVVERIIHKAERNKKILIRGVNMDVYVCKKRGCEIKPCTLKARCRPIRCVFDSYMAGKWEKKTNKRKVKQ